MPELKKIKREFTDAGHEAWLNLRDSYCGGSDAPTVIGVNPYASPFSLWAEKTGKIDRFEGNLATEVGTFMEEFVAQKWATLNGKKVRRNNYSLVNTDYPWALADIDREVVGEDAGLECKTTSALSLSKFKNGDYPPNYYVQCMHYLAVTGKARWYLAVLIGNNDFRMFTIERDEDEIRALMAAEQTFMECVKNGTPPAVDGHQATGETIGKMYPQSEDIDTLDLSAYETTLREYMELGVQIKSLEREQDERANTIKEFMKDSERGESYGYKTTWKTTVESRFDSKKFKAVNADLDLSAYTKTITKRTFKVAEKKGN